MAHMTVLKPYLIKTTGPLIRVLGDRFPSNIKGTINLSMHLSISYLYLISVSKSNINI
jgi:hypothetical protein